jgi:transposase InsO family protein
MKQRNPDWGCPRIAAQISLVFGVTLDKYVVRRVLARHFLPMSGGDGPSWLTFLGQMKDCLWSIDLFRCESATLRSHWVFLVMDQFTRRVKRFVVLAGTVDGPALCRMFEQAVRGHPGPRFLSSDHDPLYRDHRWQANLQLRQIMELKTVPYVPLSHPFIERLIGTTRREFLDHIFFWNAVDLERKLGEFRRYYDRERVHSSLDGDTPDEVAGESMKPHANIDNFRWRTHCRGLVQLPNAA